MIKFYNNCNINKTLNCLHNKKITVFIHFYADNLKK